MKLEKTKLRKIFIILILSDCKKWKTTDIIKKVAELESNHFKSHVSIFPEDDMPSKINSALISPLLKELRAKKIIKTEPIPKDEHKGRGQSGERHCLVRNILTFYKIMYLFNSLDVQMNIPDDPLFDTKFYYFGTKLMKSEYWRYNVNEDILSLFEKECNVDFDENKKRSILQILKISPTAVWFTLLIIYAFKLPEDISIEEKGSYFLSKIHQGMMLDMSNPLFKPPFSMEYEIKLNFYPRNVPKNETEVLVDEIDRNSIKINLKYK